MRGGRRRPARLRHVFRPGPGGRDHDVPHGGVMRGAGSGNAGSSCRRTIRAPSRSRRDLARINAVMRQSRDHGQGAGRRCRAPRLLADLGGGDGRFLLGVARRLASAGRRCQGRDPGPAGYCQPRDARRISRRWAGRARCCRAISSRPCRGFQPDIVTANLFLHHLDDAALARLLALVGSARQGFRRLRTAPFALSPCWARGWCLCWAPMTSPAMTRWPACAPAFRAANLSALWPQGGRWQLSEHARLSLHPCLHGPMLL